MGLSVARLGFLSAAAVLLLRGGYTGSSSHSLHIFYTLFVDSSQDGSQYIVVVYVDDQLAARFDPTTRRMLPQVAWLLNVREEDSYFLDAISQEVNSTERKFKSELHVLHIYHNSSRGFHSWQNVIGCELSDEGQKQGTYLYGYDGEPFISLDQKTLSWIAVNVQAQVTKRRWEAEPLIAHSRNDCLENKCIELLQKCVMYGKDSLLRKEPPVAKVTCGIQYKGLESLICRAYSFYPKEVNITWRKDGEVWEKGIFRAGVLPNSDGTYHAWLSIEVDPKEKKDHYRCYVEHAGLSEPLIVALEESANGMGLRTGVLVAVAVLFLAVLALAAVFFLIYVAKRIGAMGRETSTTSQFFEMHPVLQEQDQMQSRMIMKDFQRRRMEAGPLGSLLTC
ncbi:major histocompatibility complex class I-related gene protein-like isoform X2 [Ahaetulla prasina]|uniref:major histocompatibility complex class I-related gene protein-like isoform X2 n=1 Tax=Ahaetulla prasina TaxID=499056 RepID=UPI002649245B|nr:major histocompatibility complex class I-related gene protein-like isoform X2 [Ahaetulla prasina]